MLERSVFGCSITTCMGLGVVEKFLSASLPCWIPCTAYRTWTLQPYFIMLN